MVILDYAMKSTAAIVCTLALMLCASTGRAEVKENLVYVGTNTGGKSTSQGIYMFWLQTSGLPVSQNITLNPMGLAAETPSPSFLHVDEKRRLIFAVNEIDNFQGQRAGAISAFKVDNDTGKLSLINQKSSKGPGPCHLTLDKTGKFILAANYSGGSVVVLPVAADGTLGDASDFIQHSGSSVNSKRQEGPHAHCVTLDPSNERAYVCDLGIDKVIIYRFDAEKGKLTTNDPPFVQTKPGAGPRQMVFRPDGKFAYVVNELDSTVSSFSVDPKTGALTELETQTTLPGYYDGANTASGIGMHPSGKFLYVSNRGNETVVLYEIDKETGRLKWVEEQNTGGKTPRHFGIQPSAKHMAIVNQNSDTVLASRIDSGNGRLKPSGVFAKCPSPTCAVFLPPPGGDNEKPNTGD
jgi:6-phosphogluconolactonase